MLRVEDRATQLKLNHVFNVYHGNALSYLCEHFILSNNITRSETNKTFHIPMIKGTNKTFHIPMIKGKESLSFFL
jgi:hypothetical protein